jgi:hypothetical protein
MSNRVQHFIRSIVFNSRLNREKIINNNKKYNTHIVKNKVSSNIVMVIKRNMSTKSIPLSFNISNNNNNNNKNLLFMMAIMALGIGIQQKMKK